MKPWITLAIGTQKVALASSVCQADFATGEKLAIEARPDRSARCPASYSASEASKGRQVMRSPAEPASSFEFSAALYSAGAEGAKTTLISGCCASNAGISASCQIVRSSLRQDSMVSVVWACAALMSEELASTVLARRANRIVRVIVVSLLCGPFRPVS